MSGRCTQQFPLKITCSGCIVHRLIDVLQPEAWEHRSPRFTPIFTCSRDLPEDEILSRHRGMKLGSLAFRMDRGLSAGFQSFSKRNSFLHRTGDRSSQRFRKGYFEWIALLPSSSIHKTLSCNRIFIDLEGETDLETYRRRSAINLWSHSPVQK